MISRRFNCYVFWVDDCQYRARIKPTKYKDCYGILLHHGLIEQLEKHTGYYDTFCEKPEDPYDMSLNFLGIEGDGKYTHKMIMYVNLIMQFTIYHELGHAFWNSKLNNNELNGYLSQAGEYCADIFAIDEAQNSHLGLLNSNTIENYIAACSAKFNVFKGMRDTTKESYDKPAEYDGKRNTHPYPLIRLYYLIDWAKKNVGNATETAEWHKRLDRIFWLAHFGQDQQKWFENKREECETASIIEMLEEYKQINSKYTYFNKYPL